MLVMAPVIEDKWVTGGVVVAPGGWCSCTCWCHCHVSNSLSVDGVDNEEL